MDGSFLEFLGVDTPGPVDLRPLIIDSFAGGGGASTGIEQALGRSPDVAINHDPIALSMHEANHPETLHLTSSVYAIDPCDLVQPGQRVGLLWASPDCKHHSKAKGGKPLDANIRDLAWVVVHHAERIKPEVIMLENVEEFADWCPLTKEGKPDKPRRGDTFREWVGRLKKVGYKVEWRVLRACDYGAPTIRKRLFVIARCDGLPIVWPKPTHAHRDSFNVIVGALQPYRTAADIIDWSIPCPSIFDTSEQIKEKHGVRAIRPLSDNTLKRIARGIQRYVLDSDRPFTVGADPAIAPFASYAQHGGASRPADAPLHTITASVKDQNVIVTPTLINVANSKTTGRGPNAWDIREPVRTLTTSPGFAVSVATLMSYYGEGSGGKNRSHDPGKPLTTVTTENRHAVVSAFLAQHNGGPRMQGAVGRSASAPLSTLTTRGTQQGIIAASLTNLRGTKDDQLKGRDIAAPVPTISAGGGHTGVVAAFMQKYYGTGEGSDLNDPAHTLTTKDRFGVVTVTIEGEEYAIVDIGMRMLTPREQFAAQGFPAEYIIDRGHDGKPMPKTQQTHKCGNSVCPPIAEALVAANCAHLKVQADG
jgi:DNA (cytosine-5)-methyltransferase 1